MSAALITLLFSAGYWVQAVSVSSIVIQMQVGEQMAFKNKERIDLFAPPLRMGSHVYVTVRDLHKLFDWQVTANQQQDQWTVIKPNHHLQMNKQQGSYLFNGQPFPLRDYLHKQNDQWFVQLKWLSRLFDVELNVQKGRILLSYVPLESLQSGGVDEQLPVAKFYTSKSTYQMGEQVKYFDVSYSPSGEPLSERIWEGNRSVFFRPGIYTVKLWVTDKAGRKSQVYRRQIEILNQSKQSPFPFFLSYGTSGAQFPLQSPGLREQIVNLPQVKYRSAIAEQRTLLVSDSPESFDRPGVLYSDTAFGKVRLYANHVNKSKQPVSLVLVASNDSDRDLDFLKTGKGEVHPSSIANLNGYQATLEWMMPGQTSSVVVVPAGGHSVIARLPAMQPGQGVNVIYDGEVPQAERLRYTFLAIPANEGQTVSAPSVTDWLRAAQLPFDGHVRGTFNQSGRLMELPAHSLKKPVRLTIGDDLLDPFVKGFDPTRQLAVKNRGNYGVMYTLRIESGDEPLVMLLRARGGIFKGHFKINGQLYAVPESGVLDPRDGLHYVKRLEPGEGKTTILFSPPAGTAFPIDLVFYPLNDKINEINE